MKVTFLHHSGFFVETERACFLFDYWRGEDGGAPSLPEPLDLPLFIFASHWHRDHFDPVILQYGQKWQAKQAVHWILADDILPERIPRELRPFVTFAASDSVYKIAAGTEEISVTTLRSTDSGNAYLIRTGEKTLYHAGDLHLWLWREDEEEDRKMQAAFEKEIEKLKGIRIDVAFLPLDPRQMPEDALRGLDYTARRAVIGRIYPMHCWQDFTIVDRLLSDPVSEPYRSAVCPIGEECFVDEV